MVLIDEHNWPLVLVRWDTPISRMDADFFCDSVASRMKRSQRFAVLSLQPTELAGARQQAVFAALTRDNSRLAARCAGIALVWTDGRRREADAIDDAEDLGRQLRCPLRAFLDSDEALRWLRGQLAAPAPIPPASRSTRRQSARSARADP